MSSNTYDIIYNNLYNKYNEYIDNSQYVYKSCQKNWIVIMKILDDSKTNMNRTKIINPKTAKYRADKLEVVLIFNKFDIDKTCNEIINSYCILSKLKYKVGEIVKVDNYNENIEIISSYGVHFFKCIMRAYMFELELSIIEGEITEYHDDGQINIICNYHDGKLNGEYIKYNFHTNFISIKCNYCNDKLKGEYLEYYYNGELFNQKYY